MTIPENTQNFIKEELDKIQLEMYLLGKNDAVKSIRIAFESLEDSQINRDNVNSLLNVCEAIFTKYFSASDEVKIHESMKEGNK